MTALNRANPFDFTPLLRPGLPPAAVKFAGFPPYNFVGGHNDAATTPVEGLVEAATTVLRKGPMGGPRDPPQPDLGRQQ